MRMANLAKSEKHKAKYELGNLCEQYRLPPVAPSRRKHVHKHRKQITYKKNNYRNKYNSKPKRKFQPKEKYYKDLKKTPHKHKK